MSQILLFSTLINTLFFLKNRKKLIYIFIFFLPYLGFIQLKLSSYTILAPLIHDLLFIIPLTLSFLIYGKFHKISNPFKVSLIIFISILIVQLINPWGPSFVAKLVGLKVWLFYFLLIPIGMEFLETKNDLKKLCNFYSICTILPFMIGIFQFSLSHTLGSSVEVMTSFYGDFDLAKSATQTFTKFDYGNINLYRVPSTFSFVGQYNNFIIISFIPIITSIILGKTSKEKNFYKIVFLLAILAALTSGTRGNFFYLGIFFVFFFISYKKMVLRDSILVLLILAIFYYTFYLLFPLIKDITDLGSNYIFSYFFKDIFSIISNNLFGNGLGSATNAARYVGQLSEDVKLIHEGYYIKSIFELGLLGLITVLILFLTINSTILKSKKNSEYLQESVFIMLVHSFFILIIFFNLKGTSLFDNYPSNLLFLFFLGITFKLGTQEYLQNSIKSK